jgi:hypothetical protein
MGDEQGSFAPLLLKAAQSGTSDLSSWPLNRRLFWQSDMICRAVESISSRIGARYYEIVSNDERRASVMETLERAVNDCWITYSGDVINFIVQEVSWQLQQVLIILTILLSRASANLHTFVPSEALNVN